MKDPNRISKILKLINYVWSNNPDLRLGQIVSNVTFNWYKDIFYLEDDKFVELIAEHFGLDNEKLKDIMDG
jgi:hypothetical protein